MPEEGKERRSKRIYVYWGIALALLLALGLFSWTVVVPFLQVRHAIFEYTYSKESDVPQVIESLGGQTRAATRITLYLELPTWLTRERDSATSLLVHCGEEAVPTLIRLLQDKDEDGFVRIAAAHGLGFIGSPRERIIPVLVRAARALDESPGLAALVALGDLGPLEGDAVDVLRAALSKGDALWKECAIKSLCRAVPPEVAIPAIVGALDDTEVIARCAAAEALGKFGRRASGSVPRLEATLQDESEAVRQAAAKALKKIKAAQGTANEH